MQKKRIEMVHSDCDSSAHRISIQHEPGHRFHVELFLGGVSLPGLIEYNAASDQVTFTITRFPRVTIPEA